MLRMLSLCSLVLLLGGCAKTVPVRHANFEHGVYEYELANGLKVLVREDHRAPVVVSQIWYRVGSSYEHDGITGVSHVLEHMMFKGTEDTAPGEFSRIIAALGGRENAFTSRDYTAYFQRLEKSHLETALRLEADRMRNLVLREEDFDKERRVVMEERRLRTDDKPNALTFERFLATAFQVSPNRNPVIGWMDDLEHLTLADLETWYDAWYQPNNAVLVIVGDVSGKDVLELVKQHFGGIPAGEVPTLKPRPEPKQLGQRRIQVKVPAKVPSLILGYKVPRQFQGEDDWEPYALELLAWIMDGGDSARMKRELIKQQKVAVSTSASYDLYTRLPGLFTLGGSPANGHSLATLEEAILDLVGRMQQELVSQEELDRVLAQVAASRVYEQDSVFYQGMQMGSLETQGHGWREIYRLLEHLRAITPDQVRAVARKYLISDRLTVGEMIPEPREEAGHGR